MLITSDPINIQNLQNQLAEAKTELAGLKSRLGSVESVNKALVDENRDLKNQVKNLTISVDDVTKRRDAWRDKANAEKEERISYAARVEREKGDTRDKCKRGVFADLLTVIDNFEMGMSMAEKEQGSMIYVGMSMVQRQLHDFLSSNGVEEVPCKVGDLFDHKNHEAIATEISDQPEGTILRIARKGYVLKGKLIRAVNVVVAAKSEEAPTPETPAPAEEPTAESESQEDVPTAETPTTEEQPPQS